MAQDGSWAYDEIREDQAADREVPQFVSVAADPPCTLDIQVAHEHELEFYFDASGHVRKVVCSCGREATVEML